jgi:hypothetical protein
MSSGFHALRDDRIRAIFFGSFCFCNSGRCGKLENPSRFQVRNEAGRVESHD